ncbi:hypothetical protein SERLA73DRAFT_183918 [Serpula lacrymans var. lacrymans S7.3]|uniref:Uncharacterized protein n=2 Tax=Serpula lacrymans var. lacrymans TaxID=341189 RepID=F8Q246_SERL3|nr:uncharacterized protein SERLADRAFT_471327 [Serpula lacrymans var. lacrymans S7.9]EGN97257.1 hypothetical protein SERLA73DRAFT_183918 [Serpula lacrymans var. lacrymans S7.3]EGO22857.1 hypothetical protein SERLADRAFT_471327 [Serpula lacrymans var. lacrymans S7.9]
MGEEWMKTSADSPEKGCRVAWAREETERARCVWQISLIAKCKSLKVTGHMTI